MRFSIEADQVYGEHGKDANMKGDPKPDARGHGADRSMGHARPQW